jgi:hypothetical protein
MHLIRSTKALEVFCNCSPDAGVVSVLSRYASALEEFGDDLQATIIVVEADDTLEGVEQAYGERLVIDGRFAFTVELITRHDLWFEVVWITSDDGSGLVLIVEIAANADAELMTACERALAESTVG